MFGKLALLDTGTKVYSLNKSGCTTKQTPQNEGTDTFTEVLVQLCLFQAISSTFNVQSKQPCDISGPASMYALVKQSLNKVIMMSRKRQVQLFAVFRICASTVWSISS